MNEPLVSIIIPCWNAEGFIGEAINSALVQDYGNVEVIVIDDGSTDGSLEVIKSFGSHVRWITGPNRGGGAARNKGIQLARGECIQFLDADDILYPDKLSTMVPILLTAGHSILPVSDWDQESVDGQQVVRWSLAETHIDALIFCLRHPIPTPSPLHRRRHLRHVGGFNAKLPCSQERDLHLKLMAHGLQLRRVPKALHRVRRRTHSVSSDYIRILNQHETIFLGIRDLLDARGELTQERRMAIAQALAHDARHYIRRGFDSKAKRYFRLANEVDREGGLSAFGKWPSRTLARFIGPAVTERLVQSLVQFRASANQSRHRGSFPGWKQTH